MFLCYCLAEEIKLTDLTEQTTIDLLEEQKNPKHSEPTNMDKESYTTSTTAGESELTTPETDVSGKSVIELVVQDQSGTDLQAYHKKSH